VEPPGGDRRRIHRIAVMQPYFFPYAGYFRLLDCVDEFVLFDCVQFPRRGRVHRCELPGPDEATRWLTLPLARQPQDVRIADLRFAADARARFDAELRRFPWIATARGPLADAVRDHLATPLDDVVGYLERGLLLVRDLLGLRCSLRRSSSLGISPALRGQERILAIAGALGATHYLNAPGGRALYSAERFSDAGVTLEFLPDYTGPHRFLLPALLSESAEDLRADLRH
jgi:hypothetical protein